MNPNLDIRDLIICAMILIWAVRLGSFLFWRIKKDGQDKRFVVMKTQFVWFLMTWTLGGLWVLVTMAAGLAAMTSDTTIALGPLAYLGITLWVAGMLVEVIADNQKIRNLLDWKPRYDSLEVICETALNWERNGNQSVSATR